MKRKYGVALAVVAVSSLGFAALALDGHSSKISKVFVLKSHGETIAELRVPAGKEVEFKALGSSGSADFEVSTGMWRGSNGAILKIVSGTNSITVTADEIVGSPVAQ
jgi:hypothetical protein